jgi:hypothetical protein
MKILEAQLYSMNARGPSKPMTPAFNPSPWHDSEVRKRLPGLPV